MATASINRPLDLADLVKTHQAAVWRYLRYLGCDEARADDLTQETFLAVHRKPFAQRSPAESAAYLRTVARNLFLMSIRGAGRRPSVEQLDLAEDVWRRFTGEGDDYLDALRECVDALQGRARQAVEMQYHDESSRAEIAAALDMTEDGVKSLLRRTREVLRKCVEEKVKGIGD